MEKINKTYITKVIDPQLDPLQFAYSTGRGVDDAKVFITDIVHENLESTNSTARLLFADFPYSIPNNRSNCKCLGWLEGFYKTLQMSRFLSGSPQGDSCPAVGHKGLSQPLLK